MEVLNCAEIRAKGGIDKENKNCDTARRLYTYILDKKKKPKEIIACAQHNYGFKLFIEQLEQIKNILQKETTY